MAFKQIGGTSPNYPLAHETPVKKAEAAQHWEQPSQSDPRQGGQYSQDNSTRFNFHFDFSGISGMGATVEPQQKGPTQEEIAEEVQRQLQKQADAKRRQELQDQICKNKKKSARNTKLLIVAGWAITAAAFAAYFNWPFWPFTPGNDGHVLKNYKDTIGMSQIQNDFDTVAKSIKGGQLLGFRNSGSFTATGADGKDRYYEENFGSVTDFKNKTTVSGFAYYYLDKEHKKGARIYCIADVVTDKTGNTTITPEKENRCKPSSLAELHR